MKQDLSLPLVDIACELKDQTATKEPAGGSGDSFEQNAEMFNLVELAQGGSIACLTLSKVACAKRACNCAHEVRVETLVLAQRRCYYRSMGLSSGGVPAEAINSLLVF
jgi:hypothetical protein